MFLINLNAEIVACILSFRKSRHKPNLESTSKYGFPPIWGENGGVLSMRMQVILDSSFARPGSAPIWGEKKGEFRDWTRLFLDMLFPLKLLFRATSGSKSEFIKMTANSLVFATVFRFPLAVFQHSNLSFLKLVFLQYHAF